MAAKVRSLAFATDLTAGDADGPFRGKNATSTGLVFRIPGGRVGFTVEGGIAIQLTNKTGGASVKGVVAAPESTTQRAFVACPADDPDPIGVVYESGIADGSLCWVVIAGTVQVLLQDSTAGTRGYWSRVSASQAGRANATAAAPPGGGVPELDQHVREIGHCMQNAGAGTNVLCWHIIHFL